MHTGRAAHGAAAHGAARGAAQGPLFVVWLRPQTHSTLRPLERSLTLSLPLGSVHPFAEHLVYTANFAIPMLGTWACGGASWAMFYGYLLGFDFMNAIGHCNFEFVPLWLFRVRVRPVARSCGVETKPLSVGGVCFFFPPAPLILPPRLPPHLHRRSPR